jgi:uncharacterized protein (TIGR03067 family)
MAWSLLLSLVAGFLMAAEAPPDEAAEANKDVAALQGKWVAVYGVRDGKEEKLDIQLTFTGHNVSDAEAGGEGTGESTATYDLDTTTDPKTIAFFFQRECVSIFIYKLEEKQLTLAGYPGKKPPKSFDDAADSVTFRKVKSSAKANDDARDMPSGHYVNGRPQYFPVSPPFPLSRELAALEQEAAQAAPGVPPAAPLPPPVVTRTIYVPVFKNMTYVRGLELDLTQAVIREIEAKTPYKVVADRDGADSELVGTIEKCTKDLLNLSQDGNNQRVVTVQVQWRELPTGASLLPGAVGLPLFHFRQLFFYSVDFRALWKAIFCPSATLECAGDYFPEYGTLATLQEKELNDRLAVQIVSVMEKPR